ncbi:hypothetical protein SPRG_08272 [Saprolegnia parasitica CBS 223.65]|uniref:Phosphatidylinositol transfer protein N-terminal domain-containing protein n=1 Tax=Saprolegnia parasitica (strain CBS 223.65) TaxID=695850 RepID=A0A067C6Q3_SAPPC|nr:hypothetical protein SPRG_08272 [Saprolegnia parasitica CBS 223.65]KDO26469.1 hypothetical protein SPRG_08272 [Saprolegnia parasitica CBS 223.65]|eukprot:XP_012202904.1 hypothetical protein SPRG_08272 [Saprolegnia parasitica CBS 223.65]
MAHEFRIPLHMTADEYKIAELFVVARVAETSTQRVRILKNEPFDNTIGQLGDVSAISNCAIPRAKGQYTLKHYFVSDDLPFFLRPLFPKEGFLLIEEAWNAFPRSFTAMTSNVFRKEKFFISCESVYVDGHMVADNAFLLPPVELAARTVEVLHIEARDTAVDDMDPSTYVCGKTGRGPLAAGWVTSATPIMTCYKLLRVKFDYLGLEKKMQQFIAERHRGIFMTSARQAQCTSHEWHGLTLDDIRTLEAKHAVAS